MLRVEHNIDVSCDDEQTTLLSSGTEDAFKGPTSETSGNPNGVNELALISMEEFIGKRSCVVVTFRVLVDKGPQQR